jgi:Nucleotide modification associated domain 3
MQRSANQRCLYHQRPVAPADAERYAARRIGWKTMKLVLSRKGFDLSAGQVPSLILPDGTLLSLPIPDESRTSKIRYEDIHVNDESLGKFVEDLTSREITRRHFAHLDPDLNASAYPRLPRWRPLFGPGGSAHSHLKSNGIATGDLFLFFGWFRQTEYVGGKYRYVRSAPNLHVIFGWLQIGAIVSVEKDVLLPWAEVWTHL